MKQFILLCFFFCNVLFFTSAQNQIVIAHRGASGYATENTISSVKLAIEQKAHAVEIDIWRTIDDSIVVFHDRHTKRLTGDSIVVPEASYAQLRALKLPGNEYIPTLREVLSVLPAHTQVFIEIKCCWEQGEAGNVFPYVVDILHETKTTSQATFISFNPDKLEDAKKYLPNNACYWLTGKQLTTQEYIHQLRKSNIEGINVHHSIATLELKNELRQNGFGFFVWIVNDTIKARQLLNDLGIDGITTDFPDKILSELSGDATLF